jgi:hypothetical protein
MACVESGDGWEVGRIGCRCLYCMQSSLLREELPYVYASLGSITTALKSITGSCDLDCKNWSARIPLVIVISVRAACR